MKQKQSLTEKLLLIFADFIDLYSQPVTWTKFNRWLAGDPRCRQTRIWLERYFRKRKRQNFYSTIYRLKKSGYLKIKITEEGRGYFLTPKSEKKVLTLKIKNLKKKYDPQKYWLMIIFDIPEKRRKDRNMLRFYLYHLGFQKLQQSVWISPYDVYQELKKVVESLKLRQYIKFLKVKELGEF